jgi:hypothetical protein
VMASYGDFYNSLRCSGDSNSHLGASKVIAGVNRSRRWPQPRRFRRVCCRGKRQKSADWDLPPSIQPSRRPKALKRSSRAWRGGLGWPKATTMVTDWS